MLGQFRKSPILRSWIETRARRWQEVEDVAWEVSDVAASIESAVGVGLDALGALVGRGRDNAATDAIYRIALRAQIRINRSAGQIRDTLDVLRLSTGGTPHFSEPGPAAFVVWQDESLAAGEAEALALNLEQVRPLGVRGRLSSSVDVSRRALYGSRGAAYDPGAGHRYGFTGDATLGGTYSHGRVL